MTCSIRHGAGHDRSNHSRTGRRLGRLAFPHRPRLAGVARSKAGGHCPARTSDARYVSRCGPWSGRPPPPAAQRTAVGRPQVRPTSPARGAQGGRSNLPRLWTSSTCPREPSCLAAHRRVVPDLPPVGVGRMNSLLLWLFDHTAAVLAGAACGAALVLVVALYGERA